MMTTGSEGGRAARLAELLRAGVAAPQPTAQPSAPQPTASASQGWYDPSKQWDANNPLAALNTQTGYKWFDPTTQMLKNSGGDYEDTKVDSYVVSPTGERLKSISGASIGQDPNGKYFSDVFGNPTSQSDHDRTHVTYKIDENGNAVPIGANNSYDQSSWMASGPDVLKTLGAVLAAGAGGAAMAGGSGAGAGAGATAAGGTGVAGGTAATGNMALIESGLGTAGYGGAGAAGTTGGLAAGSAGAGSAMNSVLADSAMNSPGYGASSAGAGTNAGAVVGGSSPSWYDSLLSKAGDALTNTDNWKSLLDTYTKSQGGGGGGGTSITNNWTPANRDASIRAEALRKQTMAEQQNFRPTFTQGV